MNISHEALAKLKARIAENALEDDDDLLFFIQLASRMKALGDASAFNQIKEIAERPEFAGRLDEILLERCERGCFDLGELTGTPLAMSLIATQDFWLFYNYAKDTELFSSKVCACFEQWADDTIAAEVDEETVTMLENWLQTYPLAKEECLPVIINPLTMWDYKLMEDICNLAPHTNSQRAWGKRAGMDCTRSEISCIQPVVSSYVFTSSMAMVCDDGGPSAELIRQQDGLICTDSENDIQISRRLTNRWELVLEIESRKKSQFQPNAVFIDRIAAMQDPDEPECWVVDLTPFPEQMRMFLLYADTKICVDDFRSVTISCLSSLD